MPTFKRSRTGGLSPAQHHFNNAIAKLRVASEHCNGILKGQFGSLKELRLVISDVVSAAHVCSWISACIVLHNFLIVERLANQGGGDDIWEVDPDEDEPTDSAEWAADIDSVTGQRQNSLFSDFVFDKGY